jgi:hypothetical protein
MYICSFYQECIRTIYYILDFIKCHINTNSLNAIQSPECVKEKN